jgi:hypothetical protein
MTQKEAQNKVGIPLIIAVLLPLQPDLGGRRRKVLRDDSAANYSSAYQSTGQPRL